MKWYIWSTAVNAIGSWTLQNIPISEIPDNSINAVLERNDD
jgi:hypothetical protein